MPAPTDLAIARVTAAIVLAETPGVGPAERRRRLMTGNGLVAVVARAPAGDPVRRRWEDRRLRREAAERARRFVAAGGRVVALGETGFPPRLGELSWTPAYLFVRGGGEWLPRLATIVGTRRALPSACEFAHQLAAAAAAEGIAIASGMALGIDAAAHRGALAAGGETVAVLGTGLDRCYPSVHRRLMAEIAAGGLLLSELPPGTPPRAFQFPARNRILATLAEAVVVVQAPVRSGALITAAHALEAGVELLAVPGDPLLPENQGSNRLLADGARPVLGADDLLAAVTGQERALEPPPVPATLPAGLDAIDRRLLRALDLAPGDLEQRARAAGLSVTTVMRRVVQLELAGLVESLPGGRVRLTALAARCERWERRPAERSTTG